jgi:hypothetical protein
VKTIRLFQQISLQGDIKGLCVFVDLTVKTLNPSVGFPQLSGSRHRHNFFSPASRIRYCLSVRFVCAGTRGCVGAHRHGGFKVFPAETRNLCHPLPCLFSPLLHPFSWVSAKLLFKWSENKPRWIHPPWSSRPYI